MNYGKLDVWDSLLIRNIKSNRCRIGIMRRIWARRCMLELKYVSDTTILLHLLFIIETLELCTLLKFFEKLFDHNRFFQFLNTRETSETQKLFSTCISILRFTNGDKLPDYAVPSRFKREKKEGAL